MTISGCYHVELSIFISASLASNPWHRNEPSTTFCQHSQPYLKISTLLRLNFNQPTQRRHSRRHTFSSRQFFLKAVVINLRSWVLSSFKNISITPLYSIREFSLFGLFDILKYFLIGIHYLQV